MNLFEIIGPVMVGPSSSHTAGAARIGYVTRQIVGEDIVKAQIDLYGSFLATGKGHGTDRALVAGLLGMKPDDYRIPNSFEHAKEAGMEFAFGEAFVRDAHPNTAVIRATGVSGRVRTVEAASIGGGCIRVNKIDDMEANFTGDYPTLVLRNVDKPGMIQKIVMVLGDCIGPLKNNHPKPIYTLLLVLGGTEHGPVATFKASAMYTSAITVRLITWIIYNIRFSAIIWKAKARSPKIWSTYSIPVRMNGKYPMNGLIKI